MISLDQQQVYRWRSRGHHLLERAPRDRMLDVLADIGGLQAQVMSAAELQVWARVEGVTAQDIRDALWKDHSLVKTWAWRGTLHLLASSEFPTYVGALSTRTRHLNNGWLNYFGLTVEGMAAVLQGVREALDGRSLTREEVANEVARITGQPQLREAMLSGWGSLLKPSAFRGDLCFSPSLGQTVRFVRPDQWIGDMNKQDPNKAMKEIIRRYLAVYGPASREDFARWFGMNPPEAGRHLRALGDEIEPVAVEGWKGWKGWALKESVEAMRALQAPVPVKLLPHFDPYVVARSHAADYAMVEPEINKVRVYRTAGWVTPVVLVGGRIEGIWGYEKKRDRIEVKVEMFRAASGETRDGIEEETKRLANFLGCHAELEIAA